MQRFQYITVDSILAKYHRDFRGLGINEADAIEWIGEALEAIRVSSNSEESIAFLEVSNYQASLPNGLHHIIQIAKNNSWVSEKEVSCNTEVIVENLVEACSSCCGDNSNLVPVDCQGNLIGDVEVAYYRPYFDLQYEYLQWASSSYFQRSWTPVRLANHTFFNTLVCKLEDSPNLYSSSKDEYTIVGDELRFNFEKGFIALAYLKQKVDAETGYPMVPDDISARTAITYYLAWKTKETECYNHREGSCQLAENAEAHWLKYAKQFKNKSKMPFGTDQYQNLMEQSKYLLPRQNRYYGFFGKLGTMEERPFNNPDGRNRFRNLSGNFGYRR